MPHRFNRMNLANSSLPPSTSRTWLFLLGLCIVLPSLNACAGPRDIYLWHDDRGRPHYGDRATPGAQRIHLVPQATATTTSTSRVAGIYDGDTIRLENGEKIRLLGINTPETGGRGKNPEPGGVEAKAWLTRKLAGREVRLESDTVAHDKYQRRLAHVFLPDGTHINLKLVQEGLATSDIFPPNLNYVDVLLAAEREAERAGRGLWAMAAYRPKPAESLREQAPSGWQRLVGTVVEFKTGKRHAQLLFRQALVIRIPNEDLHLFPPLHTYLGKTLEARGWVSRKGSQYSMSVRHPGALVKTTD